MKPYHALGRIISPAAITVMKYYGRIRRVVRPRVAVVAKDEVLLVKSWVGTGRWELPGGSQKKGETNQEAARRELREEVGADLPLEAFAYKTTLYGTYEAPIFSVAVKKALIRPNRREIIAAQWFLLARLPADMSPLTRLALQKLSKKQ